MKLRHAFAISIISLATASAVAQNFKPEDQIKHRQASMTVIGRSVGALNGMVRGDVPFNKDVAGKHADVIANLAAWVGPSFGPGTDKGLPTKADPKIWSESDKFKAAYDKFVTETGKLPAASADLATLKTQFAEVGKTCKGCHDDYRMRDFRN